jgi:hypothetical protein
MSLQSFFFLLARPAVSIWALVLPFANNRRVSPPGFTHLTFAYNLELCTWEMRGWENDDYDEWTGLAEQPCVDGN